MEKEVYTFTLQSKSEGLKVGGEIYAPNGREGRVLEITSVKHTESGIEIKGKAKLFPVE